MFKTIEEGLEVCKKEIEKLNSKEDALHQFLIIKGMAMALGLSVIEINNLMEEKTE